MYKYSKIYFIEYKNTKKYYKHSKLIEVNSLTYDSYELNKCLVKD